MPSLIRGHKPPLPHLVFRLLALCALVLLLAGCGQEEFLLLDPKGPIAETERNIILRVSAIMLVVIIPVIVMAFLFAWRYRADDEAARYDPDWDSPKLDLVVWTIPAIIVAAIAWHVWVFTHELDPYKPLAAEADPLEVQVVALDWKWLFIYPEQGIATVNELAFPAQTPVSLRITSDTVMNSFFIPQLAGQIYAMAGMQTRLHFLADAPGRFLGRNTQYSGAGFADQTFQAIAMEPAEFAAWVEQVRGSAERLDQARYRALARPSQADPVMYFTEPGEKLYRGIIQSYLGNGGGEHDAH